MAESITDLVIRIEKTIDAGDMRTATILCDQILQQDFTNSYAWERMYQLVGGSGDLGTFQSNFAQKYYPDRVHLLTNKKSKTGKPPPFLPGTSIFSEDMDPELQSELVKSLTNELIESDMPLDLSDELSQSLLSIMPEERMAAMKEIRQRALVKAIPALTFLAKKPSQSIELSDEERAYLIDTLAEVGGADAAEEVFELRRFPMFTRADILHIGATLNKLGKPELAIQCIERHIDPECYADETHDDHLQFIYSAGEIVSPKMADLLCKNLMREKKFWNPGFGARETLFNEDPLAPLVAEAWKRGPISPPGGLGGKGAKGTLKSAAILEITPEMIEEERFSKYHGQTQMMLAYHCYVAALKKIAVANQAILLMEVTNRRHTLEQVVIALAMAQLGNRSVLPSLETLRRDPDWAVRTLAFEGLVVLADLLSLEVDSMQLHSLEDKDIRVCLAAASVMLLTGREDYTIPLMVLVDTEDVVRREAFLAVLAGLIRSGNPQARARLTRLAKEDPNENVRNSAELYLVALRPKHGRVNTR